MKYSEGNYKAFFVLFSVGIALHVLMIWIIRLFPFIDLPMHLACAHIFKNFDQPDNAFNEFFVLRNILFQPNVAHLLFCSFKGFPTAEIANKVFYTLYVLLLPASTYILIRKFKGNIWFTLLAFIFLYNYNVCWGFTDYMLGIPLLLLLMAKQYDFIMKPGFKDGIILSLFFVLLFHVHGLITFFAVALFVLQTVIFHFKKPRQLIFSGLIFIPILIVVLKWLSLRITESGSDEGVLARLIQYYTHDYLPTFPRRLGLFHWDHSFLHGGSQGKWIGAMFSVFILTAAFNFLNRPIACIKENSRKPEFRFVVSFLAFALLVYIFISSIKGMLLYSYYRFSVFVFLGLILFGSLMASNRKIKLRPVLFGIALLIHFFLWIDYFTDFQKQNRDFTPDLFPEHTQDKVLAGMMYQSLFRGQPVYMHMPNYFMIWNNGIATNRFVEFPTPWAVGRKAGPDRLPYYQEWLWYYYNYQGQYINVDYILIRGLIPMKDKDYFESFEVMNIQNEWILLQNKKLSSDEQEKQ
ncbi:hypothetical protein JW835_16925 [bacterium]|nr:hypothetical protein [bacterium]